MLARHRIHHRRIGGGACAASVIAIALGGGFPQGRTVAAESNIPKNVELPLAARQWEAALCSKSLKVCYDYVVICSKPGAIHRPLLSPASTTMDRFAFQFGICRLFGQIQIQSRIGADGACLLESAYAMGGYYRNRLRSGSSV